MSTLHLKLRQIRRSKNLSQEALARQLGISRQAVIAIEQGESLPSLPVLLSILSALDIPFNQLFSGEWSPFRTVNPQTDIAGDTHLSAYRHSDGSQSIPLTLHETSSELLINAELPGVREEDVTIDLGSQHVVILAVKKPKDTTDAVHYIQEVRYGPVMRIVALPAPVETSQAQAHFANGVLHLTLPKLTPQTKRRITFKKETHGSQ